ncbi:hypothetical protein GRO01_20150 [Gluconobacter roseus NBRC 3990]|uniref:Uncharacterized protein n=2 Tax=Gluconobacter roseus TaxID=586239 RepID=A0A4Y3MDG9_9PROT|nr:hypothetical protein AD943_12985 [Gluconobacter roseus]GBR48635.1 hypothetical protein AA3990_2191 [Gluconobacter roseus NBRC 3990]GEB04439.1 hypothetical protein GRO01_20150 [Gluconobacter roseus NBRC 3990]GLP92881.1 hypothetical protein GCM10007871_08590 [Gluconobacter roseus NBRC 3990]
MGMAYGFVVSVMVIVIGLQAFILPAAVWQGDEYDYFSNIREHGLAFLSDRMLHWSMRPFSEIVIFGYGSLVNLLHRPLTWVFLSLTWLFCAIVAFLPFLRQARIPVPARMLIAASLAAIFMLGHPSADLFYWPMATIAHLPVLAAACGLVLLNIANILSGRAEALLLTLAMTSSEAGLFLGTLWLGGRGFQALFFRNDLPDRQRNWLFFPAGTWLCLAASMIFNHRVSIGGFPYTPTHGHVWASFAASFSPLLNTMIALQPDELSRGSTFTGSAIAAGLTLKLILTGALTALFMTCGIRPALRTLILPAIALIGAMYLTIAAAFYEFGFLCCQRHETFRLDLSFLLILLLAAALSTILSERLTFLLQNRAPAKMLESSALAGLLVFTAWTGYWRLPGMSLAIAGLPLEKAAHQRLWASGLSSGTDMIYQQGTSSPAFYYWYWEPGTYHAGGPGWDVQSAMRYFGKTTIHVLPPSSLPSVPR